MLGELKSTFHEILRILEIRLFQLGNQDITVLRVTIFVGLLLSLRLLIRTSKRVLSTILEKRGHQARDTQNILRIIEILLWIVGGVILLDLIGVGVSGVMTLLAALGIGIGFGLQHLINNMFGGVILLFERPIRVGDVIETDGVVGRVKHIGWRATLISTLDNLEILIPNSHLLDNKLTNLSYSDSYVRIHIEFGVHYNSNPAQVRNITLDVAKAHPRALTDPSPQVHFVEFGDSSLNFSLRVWIDDPWDKYRVSSDIYYALFEALKRNNIEIPYPQRDLHLRSSDVTFS